MLPLSGAVSWRGAFDLPLQHLNLGHNIHDGCQVDVGGEIFVFYRNGHSFYNVTRKTRKSQKYLSSECRDERECHTESTEITEIVEENRKGSTPRGVTRLNVIP